MTVRAAAEELEPVLVDPVAGLPRDVAHDGPEAGVVDVAAAAADANRRRGGGGPARRRRRRARRSAGRSARPPAARPGRRASGRSSRGRCARPRRCASSTRSAAVKWPVRVGDESTTARRAAVGGSRPGRGPHRSEEACRSSTPLMILSINTSCPVGPTGGARYPYGHGTFVRLWIAPRPAQTQRHGPARCQVTGETHDHRDRKPEGRTDRPSRHDAWRRRCRSASRTRTSSRARPARGRSVRARRRCPGCATRLIAGRQGHAGRAPSSASAVSPASCSAAGSSAAVSFARCARPVEVVVAAGPAGRHAEPGPDRDVARSGARRRPGHPQQRPVGPAPDDRSSTSASSTTPARLDRGARGDEAIELRDRAHPPIDGLDGDVRPAARPDRRRLGPGRGRLGGPRRVLRRDRRDGRRGTLVVAVEQPGVRGGRRADAAGRRRARRARRGLADAGRQPPTSTCRR